MLHLVCLFVCFSSPLSSVGLSAYVIEMSARHGYMNCMPFLKAAVVCMQVLVL